MKSKKDKSNSNDANRDPITGEPGAHPVGTGAGAAAGGLAGAGIGAAAGPIGAGVGAAAGAVIGGLGGKAGGEAFNPTESSELGRFLDFDVVDRDGKKIGSVDAVWEDQTGQPYYLAVRTGWLHMGKAHVIPAEGAEVDEAREKIRLPYDAEMMKNAPAYDSKEELSDSSHSSIRSYFGLGADRGIATATPPPRSKGSTKDEARVQLKREEVKVGKREVEYGGVRLRKIVRTETVNQPVELQREEIVIERTPAGGKDMAVGDEEFAEEEVYIALRREEPVVQKTVRATEDIRVGKRRETDRQDIQETVRKEDVEIEQEDEAALRAKRRDIDE